VTPAPAVLSLPTAGCVRRTLRRNRYRLLAAALALVAGLVVFVVAHELFPHHSANHDEGVYLQQASMLLEGQLYLRPGSEPLRDAVRPWFFVESEAGLYPKYTPVPAAMFALGKLAGGFRLSLFAIAAANVGLAYAVAAAAFDRRTGLAAAAVLAASPLFLFSSSVFLPYAPTTALNLLFALTYVRSVRRADARDAAVAGGAIGLAFFARPYTAVLFAVPFVGHALWRLWRAVPDEPDVVARHVVTASVGLAVVGLAFAYNATVTGSPLLFPYEAFAPLDGLGFGQRRILGHDAVYTPALALRANAVVLWTLATDWFTAGPLGTAAAGVGLIAVVVGIRRDGLGATEPLSDRQLQVLLVAVVAVVAVGNVYFWGNLNVLGDIADPDDGIVTLFGPIYHFDLLLPLSALAAHGTLRLAGRLRDWASERVSPRAVATGAVLCLAVTIPVVGAAEASALGGPAEKHGAYAEKFERADAPLEAANLTNALVFVPPEYGEWRNHPFQWLRNDPGFDGPAVYAMTRTPDDDFAVLSAYPDRRYYRYRYNGEWTPDPHDRVTPVLERLRIRRGETVAARTEVTVPDRITRASVSVAHGGTTRRYDYDGEVPDVLAVNWTVRPDGVAVGNPNLTARDEGTTRAPVDNAAEVVVTITITEPGGGTLTYREEVSVRPTDDGVAALWPPASSVCVLVTECGLDGTYVPDRPDTRPDGIAMNTTRRNENA
jgi:hypothetical protein